MADTSAQHLAGRRSWVSMTEQMDFLNALVAERSSSHGLLIMLQSMTGDFGSKLRCTNQSIFTQFHLLLLIYLHLQTGTRRRAVVNELRPDQTTLDDQSVTYSRDHTELKRKRLSTCNV